MAIGNFQISSFHIFIKAEGAHFHSLQGAALNNSQIANKSETVVVKLEVSQVIVIYKLQLLQTFVVSYEAIKHNIL